MISQVLNMGFLLGAATETRSGLSDLVDDRDRRTTPVDEGGLADYTDAQIQEVVDELLRASQAAVQEQDPMSSDMWMPREPILAILQTELTRLLEEGPAELVDDTDGVVTRRIEGDQGVRESDGRRAFGPFEITTPWILGDPRWLWLGVIKAWYGFKKKVEFAGLPPQAVAIAEDARIILVGDWGSGLPRAQAVASHIRATLNEGIEEGREQHVIHLGDVYYSGSKKEYTEHFLAHWPVREAEEIGSYTLCGNHDMYRGGHEFYRTALADPRFERQKGKSVFALRNKYWQFLGLDTAYEDKRLSNGQVEWVGQQVDHAPTRRTALMSHHQLFSAYQNSGEQLRAQLKPLLDNDSVDAWFWGHEHRCLTYEPQHGVKFASCVGHGGIPQYLVRSDSDPLLAGLRYDYRERFGKGPEPWNTFGFAVIDLDKTAMTIRYVNERGVVHHSENI